MTEWSSACRPPPWANSSSTLTHSLIHKRDSTFPTFLLTLLQDSFKKSWKQNTVDLLLFLLPKLKMFFNLQRFNVILLTDDGFYRKVDILLSLVDAVSDLSGVLLEADGGGRKWRLTERLWTFPNNNPQTAWLKRGNVSSLHPHPHPDTLCCNHIALVKEPRHQTSPTSSFQTEQTQLDSCLCLCSTLVRTSINWYMLKSFRGEIRSSLNLTVL